jgi:hypothetical protein
MGFDLNGIGSLISGLPGGGEAVHWINQIGNPVMQVVSPIVNMGTSVLNSVMSLGTGLMSAGSNLAQGMAGFVNSPLFTYAIVGGLAIGGIYLIQNGGKAPVPPQIAKLLGK